MAIVFQDHNYILKSTSLEEVLKSTCRMEPKLIGYNEKPSIVTPPVLVGSGNTEVQDCEVPYRVRKANARSHIQPLTTRRAIPGISDNGECGTSESTSNSGASHNPKPAGTSDELSFCFIKHGTTIHYVHDHHNIFLHFLRCGS